MQLLDTQVLVFVMVGFVALQGLGATVFFLWLSHTIRSQEKGLDRAARTAGEKLQRLEQNLDRLTVIREKLPEMATAASAQLEQLSDDVARVDGQIETGIRVTREWLGGGDRRIQAGLLQFQRHTARMQRIVRHPAVRASALTKAGIAFLTQLLAAPEDAPQSPEQGDEEIFI